MTGAVSTAGGDAVVVAEDVGFAYRGKNGLQLDGVTFALHPGQQMAVMGATGAGKTTLAHACNGLVPHHFPGDFYGHLTVAGLPVHATTIQRLVTVSGLVMQDPEAQLTQRTVLDDAAQGPANLGLARDEVWARATEALRDVGLEAEATRPVDQLSGGQQQRLAIAGMLAMRPRLLVLDEPTSELDPAGADTIHRVLAERAASGQAVLWTDHDPDRVLAHADLLLVLDDGKPLFFGAPGEFLHDDSRVLAAGLRPVARRRGTMTPTPAADEVAGRSPVTGAPVVELRHVSHRYPSGQLALDDVSLTFRPGEFIALLGPNGAGKTTLAKHLIGLLRPTSGEVLVAGRPTADRPVHELASAVGFVFQNPDHQIFSATVFDEIAFGLRAAGLPDDELASRVEEALARTDLAGLAARHPFTLPRSLRQRVALASVLARQPQVIVVDEPTTGQDWRGVQSLMSLLTSLRDQGHTICMITHDLRLSRQYAGRAVVIKGGRITFDGSLESLAEGAP